ncbi:MAG: radical SAM protein [Candidatus Izemoplasma sp.]|nr:radical SAM protein [Candidatus Izemoplasma sp.]
MHYTQVKGFLSNHNGMNLYRGCTHGCIYCDSRSTCYQMNHRFEDINVKENGLKLLETELIRKHQKCMIGTGAMTDPYIPLETTIKYTHQALEVIYKYGFGVAIQTKSARILDDLNLLKKINQRSKAIVQMTLTTYDDALSQVLEPNVSTTKERFEALCEFQQAGIGTVVWLSPLLPFINDTVENMQGLLMYCVKAKVKGVIFFGAGLTLREGNREYFYQQLDKHFPGMKQRYQRIYGNRYECRSPNHTKIKDLVEKTCEAHGILYDIDEVFTYMKTFPKKTRQLSLF